MCFSCQKGEFDRFFNWLDRPVEESRPDRQPDRFPSLVQTAYCSPENIQCHVKIEVFCTDEKKTCEKKVSIFRDRKYLEGTVFYNPARCSLL